MNYEDAYNEEPVYREKINGEIEAMKDEAKKIFKKHRETAFNLIGNKLSIGNGVTEKWQKTLGGHQAYGIGNVKIDPDTGEASMNVTFDVYDVYDFNPNQQDIRTGIDDSVNGRFAELGWAKEFKTKGSLTKNIKWNIYE